MPKGSRGGSKAGGSGTFKSTSDFEKSLKGANDTRYKEFNDAYSEESSYNRNFKNNMNRSFDEDGYDSASLDAEEKMTKNQIKKLPTNKTPAQLGTETVLKERLEIIKELRKRKGTKGKGRGNIDIVV